MLFVKQERDIGHGNLIPALNFQRRNRRTTCIKKKKKDLHGRDLNEDEVRPNRCEGRLIQVRLEEEISGEKTTCQRLISVA